MDWGTWSPTHTALVIFAIVAFIGQVAVYFYRTGQNDKKIEKQAERIEQLGEQIAKQGEKLEIRDGELRLALNRQGETFIHALERLDDRIDKRFTETNQRVSDLQVDTNQRFSDMDNRLSAMQAETNQKLSDMQADTNHRLATMQSETNQRLSDIETGIRQLNQNHIEHLAHHNRGTPS